MMADDLYHIRNCTGSDHARVIGSVDKWWGGREMSAMLPRLFFDHFRATSFVAVGPSSATEPRGIQVIPTVVPNVDKDQGDGCVRAFLCGFVSQSRERQAYVHFAGVDPEHRGRGLGRRLYEEFFSAALDQGCSEVGCVTSPKNGVSRGFHKKMGFVELIAPGEGGGVVHVDYDGPGEDRVVLRKLLL